MMEFFKVLRSTQRVCAAKSCLRNELHKSGSIMQIRNSLPPHATQPGSCYSTAPESESAKSSHPVSGAETSIESEKSKQDKPDLRALLKQKEALYKEKDRMVAQAKQQVLSCLAEVENLRAKTTRDAESIKTHAMQTFAGDLLDMADNLHRTAETVSENFLNEKLANDTSSNAKLLKSLLEGVNMTEKQLLKIFNNSGVKKYDPIGEHFDSNHHLVINEVVDPSKEPDTIINVVKSGYFFHDKLLRPAEVDVVKKKAE